MQAAFEFTYKSYIISKHKNLLKRCFLNAKLLIENKTLYAFKVTRSKRKEKKNACLILIFI